MGKRADFAAGDCEKVGVAESKISARAANTRVVQREDFGGIFMETPRARRSVARATA
jgi:hypothetical protein